MLKIENLTMNLDGFSLKNINLEIAKGEYFVLAGPSGSGKSLLLETIAGIYHPSGNSKILLGDQDITQIKIQKRGVGLVFQDNTLFAHLSVKQNLEYALKLKHPASSIKNRLDEIKEAFGVGHLMSRNVRTLSGGEAQRVLLARAFAANPKIMLLDEPLSAVDTDQRDQLKTLLRKINRSGLTIIHVTHDFEEAFSLATSIGIMHNGYLIETGKPNEIIQKPNSKFAARFYGYKNYFEGTCTSNNMIKINNTMISVADNRIIGEKVSVLIDESEIIILDGGNKNAFAVNCFEGVITDLFDTVHGIEMSLKSDFNLHVRIHHNSTNVGNFGINQKVAVHIPLRAIRLISR